MQHNLKTVQPYFSEVEKGNKTFEFRKNDRNFQVGDEVFLQEFEPRDTSYSGKELRGTIKYILKDFEGIQDGFCILSIEITQRIKRQPWQLL